MIVAFDIPAPEFTLFTKENAEKVIGGSFKARFDKETFNIGKILTAEVSEDSLFLNVTAEWPDDLISHKILSEAFPNWKLKE